MFIATPTSQNDRFVCQAASPDCPIMAAPAVGRQSAEPGRLASGVDSRGLGFLPWWRGNHLPLDTSRRLGHGLLGESPPRPAQAGSWPAVDRALAKNNTGLRPAAVLGSRRPGQKPRTPRTVTRHETTHAPHSPGLIAAGLRDGPQRGCRNACLEAQHPVHLFRRPRLPRHLQLRFEGQQDAQHRPARPEGTRGSPIPL